MAISFSAFIDCAPFVIAIKKPILIRGRHGIGKSETVYQVAEKLGLPVVERRASQMTEGDLIGLPDNRDVQVNGIKATTFNPPDWFVTACTEPVVLFLDEVDRATPEVRQGIFELTDSRKINGHYLHEDTIVIAAVNGGEHGSQYQVGEFDPAELDRWTVFDLEPTVEDFLTWAKTNVDPMVWDFINQNRKHLWHTDDFEPNKVYPTPRSWKRFNDCAATGNLLYTESSAQNAILTNLANAFVGMEAMVAFLDFRKNYERQVTIEMLLDDGKLNLVKDWSINNHTAMIDKFEAKDLFKTTLSDKQINNLANYLQLIPSEVAMKLWTVMGADGMDVQNIVNLHQSKTADGTPVSKLIVEIVGG